MSKQVHYHSVAFRFCLSMPRPLSKFLLTTWIQRTSELWPSYKKKKKKRKEHLKVSDRSFFFFSSTFLLQHHCCTFRFHHLLQHFTENLHQHSQLPTVTGFCFCSSVSRCSTTPYSTSFVFQNHVLLPLWKLHTQSGDYFHGLHHSIHTLSMLLLSTNMKEHPHLR